MKDRKRPVGRIKGAERRGTSRFLWSTPGGTPVWITPWSTPVLEYSGVIQAGLVPEFSSLEYSGGHLDLSISFNFLNAKNFCNRHALNRVDSHRLGGDSNHIELHEGRYTSLRSH